jgi:hypothetical protein
MSKCWICLEDCGEVNCNCKTMFAHKTCLAKWHLYSKKPTCQFCGASMSLSHLYDVDLKAKVKLRVVCGDWWASYLITENSSKADFEQFIKSRIKGHKMLCMIFRCTNFTDNTIIKYTLDDFEKVLYWCRASQRRKKHWRTRFQDFLIIPHYCILH